MHIITFISLILTYVVFILLGYNLSKRIIKRVSTIKLILIVFATLLAGYINFAMIDIFKFIVKFNWCMQAFGIGIIIGLLIKMLKLKSGVKVS